MNPEEQNNQQPVINDDELKMPENSAFGAPEVKQEGSMLGPILVVLIIVLLLILGGLYLWGTTLKHGHDHADTATESTRPTAEENNEPETNNADAQVQALETVSPSDEIDAIVADIEATDLDSLDSEMNAIEAELDSLIE